MVSRARSVTALADSGALELPIGRADSATWWGASFKLPAKYAATASAAQAQWRVTREFMRKGRQQADQPRIGGARAGSRLDAEVNRVTSLPAAVACGSACYRAKQL